MLAHFTDSWVFNSLFFHWLFKNRLNCLGILHEFSKLHLTKKLSPNPTESKISDEDQNVFSNCIKAEKTPASLDEYRQKIVYLQRLDASSCTKFFDSMDNQSQFDFTDIPLRYIFGVLFENFKLIWEQLVTLIQSYAHSMKLDVFWNVFGAYVVGLSDIIEADLSAFGKRSNGGVEEAVGSRGMLAKFSGLLVDPDQNVDYRNVRFLLCQAMQGFSNSCEARTRLLVPIFFRFVKWVVDF